MAGDPLAMIRRKSLVFLSLCKSQTEAARREYADALDALARHAHDRLLALDVELEREARAWVAERREALAKRG